MEKRGSEWRILRRELAYDRYRDYPVWPLAVEYLQRAPSEQSLPGDISYETTGRGRHEQRI